MTIEFGKWQLRRMDALNWQLWHRHVATTGKNQGVEDWYPMKRYYSYSTFDNAIMFAADYDIRATDGTVGFTEFVELWRETVDEYAESIQMCLGCPHSCANQKND